MIPEDDEDEEDLDPGSVVELPINGVLDLHSFRPKEVASVVNEYIEACHEQGIVALRIIHGKGIGHLRRTVHALLETHPRVGRYELAPVDAGSWGATLVWLKEK